MLFVMRGGGRRMIGRPGCSGKGGDLGCDWVMGVHLDFLDFWILALCFGTC